MKNLIKLILLFFTTATFAQAGHLMAGVGSINTSMGGAATGQPIDINGAMQWNPAAISAFDSKIINLDVGLFFASPELSSTIPEGMMFVGSPEVTGITKDSKGVSPMPALGMVWGNADSKHTFGVSIFGVSGFGVDFAEETNLPMDGNGTPNANWNPNESNVISYPQNMGGFGHISSNYMLLQVGVTYAYEISDKFSIGIQPTFNYAALELAPNPTSSPSMTLGYPVADNATATGFGAQFGFFYNSGIGFKAGVSYKTTQSLSDLEFQNTYLDGSEAPGTNFNMDFPAIFSVGLGYSNDTFDFALDYRMVDYENTDGFAEKGWTNTASVAGFGWKNINIISTGLQYKGIPQLPIRIGYTYSSNPIDEELVFFSVSAPAVIKNAFQFGLGYEINDNFTLNAVYHHGESGDKTEGEMLNPLMVSNTNPYGAIPGTKIGYKMSTDLVMLGISYSFNK